MYIINLTDQLLDRANDGVTLEEIANSLQANLFYTYGYEMTVFNILGERRLISKLCKPSLLHTTLFSISVMELLVYVDMIEWPNCCVEFLCYEQI